MKDHKAKIMKNSLIYRIESEDQIFIKKLSQANALLFFHLYTYEIKCNLIILH